MNSIYLNYIFVLITFSVFSQRTNQEIVVENEPPFMVGQINKEGLTLNTYADWYNNNYDDYEVDLEILNSMKSQLADYNILIFMGTWCGDSKREVPRFLKILDAVDFPMENLKIIGLDRRQDNYKKSPNGEEWGLLIQRVPTIIFMKNGKESNRIIESPIVSLEADTKAIINNVEYTPHYAKSLHFD